MDTLKLSKAISINGKFVSEIEYDLERLTGNDIEIAMKQCVKNNHSVIVMETDQIFHSTVFAISAGLSYNDLKPLSAKDILKAGQTVRNFLFLDLAEELAENTSEKSEV